MLLDCVAVRPEAAGRSLGRALIGYCETIERAEGCTSVCLYTNEKMTRNLSMYPRLGYRQVGHRMDDGFARVFFEKRLT